MTSTQIITLAVVLLLSYLLGSLNSAIALCKLIKKDDIRKYGSKNAGLTNVLRVYGKPLAGATLLCDIFKGVVAVIAARLITGSLLGIAFFGDSLFIGYAAGFAVVLGHVFPVFYGFRGGKGVLTACTTMMAVDPLSMGTALLIFIAIVAVTKYVSLGSIAGAAVNPIATFVFQTIFKTDGIWINTLLAAAISIIVIVKHKQNIVRLINGNENKLSFKSKAKQEEQ